jgi:hypothetical protein
MPIFESLEMRPGELPPPVVSRATTERWFPALTVGQTAAFAVVALAWLLQGLVPLSAGSLWAQVGAGRALAAQAISGGANALLTAARGVGPGWLGDLKLYAAWAVAGDEGLVLLPTTLVTLATGGLLFALRSRGADWGLAASLAGAGMLCAALATPAGTASFGLLGLAALAWVLADAERRPGMRWLLPPLFLVWANLDASFLFGLAWLAAWASGRCFRAETVVDQANTDGLPWAGGSITHHEAAPARRSSVVAANLFILSLSVAACIVQPLGARGVLVAWQTLNEQGQSLSLSTAASWGFAISLVAGAFLLRHSKRRVSMGEALACGMAGLAALANAAWLPLWAVVWVWATAPHWKSLAVAGNEQRGEASATKTSIALAAVFLAIMWSPPSRFALGAPARPVGEVMSPATPLALAAEIEERSLQGAAFFSPRWADYLSFRSGGRLTPLVNSLVPHDQGVWRDALGISAANHGWLEIADHYRLRYLLVGRADSPELAGAVQREKRCRVLYQDQQGLLVELLPAAAKGL